MIKKKLESKVNKSASWWQYVSRSNSVRLVWIIWTSQTVSLPQRRILPNLWQIPLHKNRTLVRFPQTMLIIQKTWPLGPLAFNLRVKDDKCLILKYQPVYKQFFVGLSVSTSFYRFTIKDWTPIAKAKARKQSKRASWWQYVSRSNSVRLVWIIWTSLPQRRILPNRWQITLHSRPLQTILQSFKNFTK